MMRFIFGWTIIFRGHFLRTFIGAFGTLRMIFVIFFSVIWQLIMIPIIVSSWIFGIDWYRIQLKVYRGIKDFFT